MVDDEEGDWGSLQRFAEGQCGHYYAAWKYLSDEDNWGAFKAYEDATCYMRFLDE